MLRIFFAIIIGGIAGIATMMLVEYLSSMLFPMPTDLDTKSLGEMKTYMDSVPIAAKAMVLVGWTLGSVVGGYVATRLARNGSAVPGIIVGLVLLAAGGLNFLMLPHPIWMVIAGVILLPLPAVLVSRMFAPRFAAAA